MRILMLAAAVGLICVTASGCNTISAAGDGIASAISGGVTALTPSKAPKEARPAAEPRTNTASGPTDRGCVQATERVSLGTPGSWASGELCIGPHSLTSHQVKLTLTGTGNYSCHAQFCSLDIAFGEHEFQTLVAIDGAAEAGALGGMTGVVFITNRGRIEKAIAKDPVMSIRIPFGGGQWGILKFDTRGLKAG